MNLTKNLVLSSLLFLSFIRLNAAQINSAQTGDWSSTTTWVGGVVPLATDDVIIKDGHVVTKTGSAYTHTGNFTIEPTGEFIADMGNSSAAFTFTGPEMHVFGALTFTFPDKDFIVGGNAFFWGHPSAVIYVSDDWQIEGNSETLVEGICVEVDDDFHINGTGATLCGNGGVSIGTNTGSNTYSLGGGATNAQVCQQTIVYRGEGGSKCTIVLQVGTGNNNVVARNDIDNTNVDVPITIDVLDMGVADSDTDGDDIEIIGVGVGYTNDNTTQQGGTVTINNNGTPLDPTDDFIDYTPPAGFVGDDTFLYVVRDGNGGYDWATVIVKIANALPVEFIGFELSARSCNSVLEWATASEENNDYFEILRSRDGINFEVVGQVEGAGTSSGYRAYQFVDRAALDKNYYKIKQIDFNGNYSLTQTLESSSPCAQSADQGKISKVFPNPIQDGTLNIMYEVVEEESNTVLISTIFGEIIKSYTRKFEIGRNHVQVETDDLISGTYLLSIGRTTTKFQKISIK